MLRPHSTDEFDAAPAPLPPLRWRRVVAVAVLGLGVALTACQPVAGLAVTVAGLSDAEQSAILEVRRQNQLHPFLTCVRRHESDRGAWPHTNGYLAKNPISSASGAYQFLNSTWRNVAPKVGGAEFARAMDAPPHIQDDAALWMINNGYKSAWNGTGCK